MAEFLGTLRVGEASLETKEEVSDGPGCRKPVWLPLFQVEASGGSGVEATSDPD